MAAPAGHLVAIGANGRRAVWIGPTAGTELALAAEWLATLMPVETTADASGLGAGHARPRLVVLACPRPACWTLADLTRVATTLPLVPVVAVTTSLAEGSRRSGDLLPGVEEIPWIELPGRIWSWIRSPLPTTFGMSRRDERWLAPAHTHGSPARRVHVAADRDFVEPVCDLLSAAGWTPLPLPGKRPQPGCDGAVVWALGGVGARDREWLRLLTADGRRDVLVMESFPRGDGVVATLAAGAAAVLPRTIAADSLAGTLGWMVEGAERD
ncbi:MAG: hypothetical protein EBR86_05970 [Planctomycetia bacterium]|nr:hypothetical protein [Planctomycetia bacterium]